VQLTLLSTHWAKIKKGTIFFGHSVYRGIYWIELDDIASTWRGAYVEKINFHMLLISETFLIF
jgi:hypothetical protein